VLLPSRVALTLGRPPGVAFLLQHALRVPRETEYPVGVVGVDPTDEPLSQAAHEADFCGRDQRRHGVVLTAHATAVPRVPVRLAGVLVYVERADRPKAVIRTSVDDHQIELADQPGCGTGGLDEGDGHRFNASLTNSTTSSLVAIAGTSTTIDSPSCCSYTIRPPMCVGPRW
jgi:hypothetical protein